MDREHIKNEIIVIKGKLKDTDYQAIKFAEGELTISEYAPIREQRKAWREQINNLETQIKGVK